MKKTKKIIAVMLTLALLVPAFGCAGSSNGVYRGIKELSEQRFSVAFRSKDSSADAVLAAMAVLQADGTVRELSEKWFNRDVSLLSGDAKALDALEELPAARTYNIGYDAGRLPFSGKDKYGAASGFDVELAKAVCKKLGWRTKFIAVDVSQAEVELNSGNVDCIWGAYEYDGESEIRVSPIYATSKVVVVSRSDSDVGSVGALSGKTLMLGDNAYFKAMVEADGGLSGKPGYIVEVSGGAEECFKALDDGECDAIVADELSMEYYR